MRSEVVVPLSPEDVRALVAAFDGADWDEMTLTIDGTRLVLSRSGRPPIPADSTSAAPGAPATSQTGASAAVPVTPPAGHVAAAAERPRAEPAAGPPSDPAAAAAPSPPAAGPPSGPAARGAARAAATTAAGAVPPAPAAAPGAPSAEPAGQRVTAPSVGLFWRSPKPGAPPFVEVGDEVGPDDTVCIVEVMKLMNHVRAGVAGTVAAVHPENGQMVEHGDPLFTIEPAG
jgi:acetyl-CoA carboxylase biotin carboxyl carrier protein